MRQRALKQAAFSLTETVVALGILASVGVALVGLLGVGINTTGEALSETQVAMLVENVQAHLTLNPAWPKDEAPVFFDDGGAEVEEEEAASFRVELTRLEGPGFASGYLDTFRVSVQKLPQQEKIGSWTLQRARLSRGKPIAALEDGPR